MQKMIDTSAAFLLFLPLVPRELVRELLVEQGFETHKPRQISKVLQAFAPALREEDVGHAIDLIIARMQTPFDSSEISDEFVDDTCRQFLIFRLIILDEARRLIDSPDAIMLTDRLLLDLSSIPNEADAEEIAGAVSGSVGKMMHMTFSFDRAWRLYDAFTEAVRAEMAGKAERIEISSDTILVVLDGRFSLEEKKGGE